ncbi:IS21 family transposase [Cryobacterium sp. MDB1-18-2]|uniref:IS21 family transposase n=1 Tax=unclassified Cryobacterium TaxID=2649013 RepID=UPI00106A0C9E|nr:MULTISPECIES: IS21 family transposase [unclassified Cryobacterium]TFC33906.1 IS21 family transposase [Cryobacterium sp. MDB1-18-2]TFC36908.1 IS21 family transposase [Cryobacterium sp. MDB1-18-1]
MVRKIKAKLILQLRNQGLSRRAIESAQGISRHSIQAVLDAAEQRGLGWDDFAKLPEAEVYAALFPGRGVHESVFAQPDWVRVHTELARVGVTLKLLHQEYVDASTGAGQARMSYDRFCRLYGDYAAVTGATSRVGHKAGRSIEVDWSGPTMQLVDPTTGEVSTVYLFVACLPFSRYAFVEAALDMRQESWLRAHAAMFAFFGGSVPRLVPDNLKTGVISHPREGEVVLNDAYREMAAHYSAAVLPGRVRAPKDKASVENTVSHVATWVIAGLRHEAFTSLAQLRGRIREQIDAYNRQPFQKRDGSRLSVFTTEELPLMQPLPAAPFEISTWSYKRKVNKNAHVVWARNFYSVPFSHIGALVDLRVTDTMLEVYRADERLTCHLLLPASTTNQYQTNEADLPEGRSFQAWDRTRIEEWAARMGPATTVVIGKIFETVFIDEAGFDAALAVLRLSRRFSPARVEAACQLALRGPVRSPRYAHLRPILDTGQDKTGHVPDEPEGDDSGYVRGSAYYAGGTR